jgi:hypothetical protein
MQHTQRRARGNRSVVLIPVSQLRWNRERPTLAGTHVEEALIPSFNDLVGAEFEWKRLSTIVAGVELAAITLQRSLVIHNQLIAILGLAYAVDGPCDIDAELLRGSKRRQERDEEVRSRPHYGGVGSDVVLSEMLRVARIQKVTVAV